MERLVCNDLALDRCVKAAKTDENLRSRYRMARWRHSGGLGGYAAGRLMPSYQLEDASVREADARLELREVIEAIGLDAFRATAVYAAASMYGKAQANRILAERCDG